MKRNLKSILSLALLTSIGMASTQALAQLYVAESTTANGANLNLVLPVNLPSTDAGNYWTGLLNIKASQTQGGSGSSFAAFCIDPSQYANGGASDYSVSTGLSSLGSTKAALVSNLYSQSYASSIGNATGSAAFQLALWDLAKDDGKLSTGAVKITSSTNSNVVDLANTMITNAQSGAGPAQYSFSLYSSASAQDYVVASAVAAVPEPQTYAMLLSGMCLLGFTAKRRMQKANRV